jgi:hypothetical protein
VISADCVQDDVDRLPPVLTVVGHDLVGAETVEEVGLGGGAHGRDDPSDALDLGQLDGEVPHSARGARDQDRLAGERVGRGEGGEGDVSAAHQRDGLDGARSVRYAAGHEAGSECQSGVRAAVERERRDAVADLEVRHIGAECDHRSGDLASEDSR